LSRTSIYTHAQRVEQAVVNEQAGGLSDEALGAENERLRAANAALWEAWAAAEPLPEANQPACAATGSARGLRLGQLSTLLAIFLPHAVAPSRATVGRWVAQASRQAGGRLAVLDQYCQAGVLVLCVDDIFFHREPILMAVEPHRRAWVAGQRGPHRSGDSGCARWAQWPGVTRVIADAGKGLERGVKLATATRVADAAAAPEAAGAIPIEMGLELFPTQHELQRVRHRTWRQAERQLEAASTAAAKVEQSNQRGRDARGAARQAGCAGRKAERLCDHAVVAEAAAERVAAALALLRPEGDLNDRQWAQAPLRDATEPLTGQAWGKVRRLRRAQRTLMHRDWTHEQLAQRGAAPLLREA
jgi:hypothetical protein